MIFITLLCRKDEVEILKPQFHKHVNNVIKTLLRKMDHMK